MCVRLMILFVFLFSVTSFGQSIDKTWKTFRSGPENERLEAAKILHQYYVSENIDSLRVIGEELFFFGIDRKYFPAIEQGKLILAEYFIYNGKSAEAITSVKGLLSNMQERGDYEQLSFAEKIISSGYRVEKDGKSALYWAKEAVKHASQSTDPEVRFNGMISLAEAHLLNKDIQQAIDTYNKFIRLNQPLKRYRALSSAHARLGDIYRNQKKLDLAERQFKLSFKMAENAGLTTPLGHAINNLGIISFERGDTTLARQQFLQALDIRQQAQDKPAICESFYNLGDYHYYIGKQDQAMRWYQQSLRFAVENNLKTAHMDALQALAQLSKQTKAWEDAVMYLEQKQQIAEQLQIDQSKDDADLMAMEQAMYKAEVEANIDENPVKNRIMRWEWPVMAVLFLIIVLLAFSRQSRNSKKQIH